jgi:hypothetical protein
VHRTLQHRALVVLLAGVICWALLPGLPVAVARSDHAAAVATVRAIKRTLLVAPAKQKYAKGKVKQRLVRNEAVRTGTADLASLGFTDGTILHINQDTDAVLTSPSQTKVAHGEVDQIVQPGTTHTITTPVAAASAIGTNWDTVCAGTTCIFTVVEGAVEVANAAGSVIVTTNQQTTVHKGQAPSQPVSVDAAAAVIWTQSLPPAPPTLGANLALQANGGQVQAGETRSGPDWSVANLHDGNTQTGWQSGQGQTTAGTLTFGFGQGSIYQVTGIVIDPAATGGEDAANDLKDFTVQASRDGKPYSQVMTGQTHETNALQRFTFSQPVDADHVQLVLQDNWGGADGIALAEVEIVGQLAPIATPLPTATPTATPKPTPKPSATSTLVPLSNVQWTIHAVMNPVHDTSPSGDSLIGSPVIDMSTCGQTPYANAWTGTLSGTSLDVATNTTSPIQAVTIGGHIPEGQTTTVWSLNGAMVKVTITGTPPTATVEQFSVPSFNPQPADNILVVPVNEGGACTP